MNLLLRILALIGVAAAIGAGWLYWQERRQEPATPEPVMVPAAPLGRAEAPEPRYPIPVPTPPEPDEATPPPETPAAAAPPEEDVREPLPPLNRSTPQIVDVLTGMLTAETLHGLFNTQEFVRRFVVTVDALPGPRLPRQHLLLFKRVHGAFQVAGDGEDRVIADTNAARYAAYLQLAQRIETRRLVNVYERYYPLFQEAYAELGNPDAYFNDRVVEVIDHLLATPVVHEPPRVVQPKVFYQYADPELESLSAGQKALLRMGSANAAQIKVKLRELRAALTGQSGARAQDARSPDVPTE